MSDGIVVSPGAGHQIQGSGMVLKVGAERTQRWSVFEALVAPGFDVGAHLHSEAEELFYIVDGELDLLAFEPRERTRDSWHGWKSRDGTGVVRGGPGSLMFVPAKCPHAFSNPGAKPVRMLFLFSPAGHEEYLQKVGELVAHPGPPDPSAIADLRARYDIQQLTPLIPGRRPV
ncbi:MAG TPA: cupin domain-containing protein [Thermoplasmata archaeon]|nr:cupin domain-containing protein [Thermoplasmata archaeon]